MSSFVLRSGTANRHWPMDEEATERRRMANPSTLQSSKCTSTQQLLAFQLARKLDDIENLQVYLHALDSISIAYLLQIVARLSATAKKGLLSIALADELKIIKSRQG